MILTQYEEKKNQDILKTVATLETMPVGGKEHLLDPCVMRAVVGWRFS